MAPDKLLGKPLVCRRCGRKICTTPPVAISPEKTTAAKGPDFHNRPTAVKNPRRFGARQYLSWSILLVVLIVGGFWLKGIVAPSERGLVLDYLRSHHADPTGLEITETRSEMGSVRDTAAEAKDNSPLVMAVYKPDPSTTLVTVSYRAKNQYGAFSIFKAQLTIRGGKVVECLDLTGF